MNEAYIIQVRTYTHTRNICNFHVYLRIVGVGKFYCLHIPKYNSKISQVDCCIHASQQKSESTMSHINTIVEKELKKKRMLAFCPLLNWIKKRFLVVFFQWENIRCSETESVKRDTYNNFTMQHVPWRDVWNPQSKTTYLMNLVFLGSLTHQVSLSKCQNYTRVSHLYQRGQVK